MHQTNIKTIHKEKKQKKLGPKIQSADSNQTNTITVDKHQRKYYELSNLDNMVQAGKPIDKPSVLKELENFDKLKEGYIFNNELATIQQKIADLVNQRDDLITYHRILTGSDQTNCLKTTNLNSLEAEIADLKSLVVTLQKGLQIVFNEHSAIKNLLVNQLNDMDNLLERNLNQGSSKNKYKCSENVGNYLFPRLKESSDFLNRYMDSNQSIFDICKTPILNYSSSNLFKTISKISAFGEPAKTDSLAKFRQLAELKIIIEILQKYSKIITEKFINLKIRAEVADKISSDSHLETIGTIDQQVHGAKFQLSNLITQPRNDMKSCHTHLEEWCSSEVCTEETKLKLPKKDLNVYFNQSKRATELDTEDQRELSEKVLKSNLSKEHIKNILDCEKSCKNIDNTFFIKVGSLYNQSVVEKENYLTMTNNKQILSLFKNDFEQDDKQSKKKKVLFLSDGYGRYCSQFLQEELGHKFSVISVVKPDALFTEIIKDFQHLASTLTREDYVIIFAGSNNLKCKDKTQSHIEVELALSIFNHTNVIFTRIPLLFDHPSLNSQIRKVNRENNKKVFDLARTNSNFIFMPKFTFFSRDPPKKGFNKIGIKTLCKLLAKTIITNSFRKKHKRCFESQRIKTLKYPAPLNQLEATSSHLLDCFHEVKIPTTVISGENTKSKEYGSVEDVCANLDQINKHEVLYTHQQFMKSAETQTSEDNLYECSFQTTNEKFMNISDELNEGGTISKNYLEKVKHDKQTTALERHSSTDRRVEDISDCYNLEDLHQGLFAGIFMKNNHTNMTTIKELLGQGDIPKPRKNFIQENVKKLKELKLEKTNKFGSQRSKNNQPLTERRNAQTMVSSSRFSHSTSQQTPSPPLRSRRTNKHVTLDTQTPIIEVQESPKGYRSLGCQTLSSKQLDKLYDEGVIRYPSVRNIMEGEGRTVREMALQTETPLEVLHPPPLPTYTAPPQVDEGLHWDEERKAGDKDFVKMNAAIPDPQRHRTPDLSSTDPTRAPPTYQRGVVPKYLREHKKEMERDRINKAKDDECPEGHIQLPDDIKNKHLTTLRQNYADLVSQLNQLPVSTDTLRTRTRKKQIEADLDRIEAAIALFSREKVFVKADS